MFDFRCEADHGQGFTLQRVIHVRVIWNARESMGFRGYALAPEPRKTNVTPSGWAVVSTCLYACRGSLQDELTTLLRSTAVCLISGCISSAQVSFSPLKIGARLITQISTARCLFALSGSSYYLLGCIPSACSQDVYPDNVFQGSVMCWI